ncbi:MAG TPA: hypothetical protein VN673_09320, partial [Clostridia bacterium]|nr:hypothetical protein [Clostridia bacterium]
YLLRLMQGTVAAPEREIRVYLRLKSGEKIAGQKLEISPEMKGTGVPQVVKAWKTNPRYAAQTKTYGTGYVLKLELGEISEGAISGKIFVALPDPEATVAAGVFRAETSLVEGEDATAVVPTVAPVPGQTSPESEAFRKRYGR